MGVELQKPYTIDEIRKHPYAVFISLLIGLLLLSVSSIVYLISENNRLYEKAENAANKRIDMYENMIFYQQENSRLKNEQIQSDSLLRDQTEPFVHKILKYEE